MFLLFVYRRIYAERQRRLHENSNMSRRRAEFDQYLLNYYQNLATGTVTLRSETNASSNCISTVRSSECSQERSDEFEEIDLNEERRCPVY